MEKRAVAQIIVCGISVAFFETEARARFYDMYRSDYEKGAFCVALGGACASDDNPENSFFQNPAALEAGEKGLIFDGDYNPSDNIEPGMKVSDNVNSTVYMAGVGWAGPEWGYALSFSGRQNSVSASATLLDDQDRPQPLQSTDSNTTLFFNFPIAKKLSPDLSVGFALLALYYTESFDVQGSPSTQTTNLDHIPQVGLSAGFLYSPSRQFRIGSWARSPMTYYVKQNIYVRQASNQVTLDEDLGLSYPWVLSNGISFMPWADRHTIFFDLDFIGLTPNGYERTLDTFSSVANSSPVALRQKGRALAVEPHLAWRSPCWSGSKGTYTLATYYENGRWNGIGGRVHAVSSLAYQFTRVPLVDTLETIGVLDVSRDYFSFQFSFR